jgi:hypothetical protein
MLGVFADRRVLDLCLCLGMSVCWWCLHSLSSLDMLGVFADRWVIEMLPSLCFSVLLYVL